MHWDGPHTPAPAWRHDHVRRRFRYPHPETQPRCLPPDGRLAGKVWHHHGAIEFRECVGDDLDPDPGSVQVPPPLPAFANLKRGETVLFSFIAFKSRAHRDRVDKRVMSDPRMLPLMDDKRMPFEAKRMVYGGFKVIVDE